MFFCVETIYCRIMLYTSKDRKKNTFSDDFTVITLSAINKVCELKNQPSYVVVFGKTPRTRANPCLYDSLRMSYVNSTTYPSILDSELR